MVTKIEIDKIISGYKNFKIATICSHSSLQIFKGARAMGIKTIGIVKKEKKELYESFPLGRPDEFIVCDDYADIPEDELIANEAILIPHGSLIEYTQGRFSDIRVPIYGNRKSIEWESSREKMFKWLKKAKLKTPKIYKPEEIDGPAFVKFPGAKGGKGYIIVNSYEEFVKRVGDKECMIQEFLVGVRAYPHYFFSPFSSFGYKTKNGRIELLGVDRRVESSADEIARAVSAGVKSEMAFTVIGNEPLVLRESLLSDYMEMGKRISDSSFDLFNGLYGPYCIETMITEDLDIYAFEVSARIVAGTNVYVDGSAYSTYYYNESMSMGKRMAMELKLAKEKDMLSKIIY